MQYMCVHVSTQQNPALLFSSHNMKATEKFNAKNFSICCASWIKILNCNIYAEITEEKL
jgi:hypothetical protein